MKILINIPSLKLLGGVANHYLGLKCFWTENVKYNIVGKRSERFSGVFWLPWDLLKFIIKIIFFKPDVILLNPSLGPSALKRDFLFLNIAVLLNVKVAVFIHGFNLEYSQNVDKKWLCKNLNKASLILVLASSFREYLKSWGVTPSICLTTTKVDDALVSDFDINSRVTILGNILCVTRIEKEKGVYESLEAFHLLKQKYRDLTFTLVGDGNELPAVRKYVQEKKIDGVTITGRLDGNELIKEFQKAGFFFFTSYGEGMPTCVLEAMAFGLPVFTRKVGGLVDFFDGRMGFITDSLKPSDFANACEAYLNNIEKYSLTATFNYQYANKHFMASSVAKSLEKILRKVV